MKALISGDDRINKHHSSEYDLSLNLVNKQYVSLVESLKNAREYTRPRVVFP